MAEVLNAQKKAGFPWRLASIRGALGLSKAEERALRGRLEKGRDFEEVGHEVRYSDEGRHRLAAAIGGDGEKMGAGVSQEGRSGASSECGVQSAELRSGAATGQPGAKKAVLLLAERSAGDLPVRVTVYRGVGIPNKQVIECLVVGSAAKVNVRVRSNENFLPGMVCWARPPGDGGAGWVFMGGGPVAVEGGHCPRWRGKW